MFERLHADVRRALAAAADEATLLGHRRVGPDHILIGLLLCSADAIALLGEFGVDADQARERLTEYDAFVLRDVGVNVGLDVGVGSGRVATIPARPRLSRPAGNILRAANRVARRSHQRRITGRHVVIALAEHRSAARLLAAVGAPPVAVLARAFA